MSLLRYRTPSLLDDFRREINELYNNSLGLNRREGELTQAADSWMPAVDIKEENDRYLVKADLPGVQSKDVDVHIDEQNRLVIRGEKHHEAKESQEGFLRLERSHGTFYRAFSLPETVDKEGVSAKVQHGLLEIVLPKAQKATGRKIPVAE